MQEEIFQKSAKRLDEIYSLLIKGESTSGQEAELRVEIIDLLSNIQAAVISIKAVNQDFIIILEKAREMILEWDPFGHWFRQQKELIDIIYDVIVRAKSVVITTEQNSTSEASKLKQELDTLKSELNDLRSLMSNLIKEKTSTLQSDTLVESPEIDSSESEIYLETDPPIMEPIIIDEKNEPKVVDSTIESSTQLNETDPLIILPLEREDPLKEVQISPPIIEEKIEAQEEQAEIPIMGKTAIEKLTAEKSPETAPANVLSKMKSIIDEAEIETEKQMLSFKEEIAGKKATETITIDEIAKPILPPIVEEQESEIEKVEQPLVKPSDMLKQQKSIESSISSGEDPYMQLLTLEAEKYRLEKEMEKNETDFQEGLKSKLEFDESIQIINQELSLVREKIEELRQQLIS
ncbi:MAG: hypothetical protein EAX90_00215 [Candidatus Heimdallarchaeota archaeon]|nr:hypothetical protein [Candidatus Heimdallarchaeota archaeon]